MHVDYNRTVGETPRPFATIYLQSEPTQAISTSLIGAGLATCVKHRAEDDRSEAYDAMQDAEAMATAEKKGVHSTKVKSLGCLVLAATCQRANSTCCDARPLHFTASTMFRRTRPRRLRFFRSCKKSLGTAVLSSMSSLAPGFASVFPRRVAC